MYVLKSAMCTIGTNLHTCIYGARCDDDVLDDAPQPALPHYRHSKNNTKLNGRCCCVVVLLKEGDDKIGKKKLKLKIFVNLPGFTQQQYFACNFTFLLLSRLMSNLKTAVYCVDFGFFLFLFNLTSRSK